MNYIWICIICIIVGYLLRNICKFLRVKINDKHKKKGRGNGKNCTK